MKKRTRYSLDQIYRKIDDWIEFYKLERRQAEEDGDLEKIENYTNKMIALRALKSTFQEEH